MTKPTPDQLERALTLAVNMLAPHEPPDSRAVSNEFVAVASVSAGDASGDVMKVIDNALGPKFIQADYNSLVDSLDKALAVFQRTAADPEEALKDFVLTHYFKVWRGMAKR